MDQFVAELCLSPLIRGIVAVSGTVFVLIIAFWGCVSLKAALFDFTLWRLSRRVKALHKAAQAAHERQQQGRSFP